MDQVVEIVWSPFEATLRKLYLEQDMSLADVMRKMATEHEFNATKSQYELQFKKWQFRKNRTADEWKIIACKLTARKKKRKESEVFLNGNLIHPKKLRKETLRYGSMSKAIEILPRGSSPSTPEGFIIRTPSPKFTTSFSTPEGFIFRPPSRTFTTSLSTLNVHLPMNLSSVLLDCLPFHHFQSIFNHAVSPFLSVPENGGSESVFLYHDIHSGIIEELTGRDGKKIPGAFGETINALLPENVFPSNPTVVNMAISERQPSSVTDFLKLSMYLVSNNFFRSTTDISLKVYEWVKRPSNAGLMEYLLSIGGPTVEALAENLFRLAIDAEDVRTLNKMMKLGINPNEQVYRTESGSCCTSLHRACEMLSLKLVMALIDGGAKVDLSVGNKGTESVLMAVMDGLVDEDINDEDQSHLELVRILLNAGAAVNPGLGQFPLATAVELGCVEIVDLLVSAGADVNIIIDGYKSTSTPLIKAIERPDDFASNADMVSIVQILLKAGADPHGVSLYKGKAQTPLEAAMAVECIEVIQLLLENGARVTENSFVQAVQYCDSDLVELLLKFGGQITESVIESAVESSSTLLFFLLEAANDNIKQRCKTAAFIKSLEWGKMDLIHMLSASGVQLTAKSNLQGAIGQIIESGNMPILRFLLDEKSENRMLSLESLDGALWTAITNDRTDIVELLLMEGANVNSTKNYKLSQSPLLEAIRKKNSTLVKQLLIAGAAVNGSRRSTSSGRPITTVITTTVLPAVVDWGLYPLIQDVIDAGAEIDAPEILGGKTALFLAVEKNDKEAIRLLVDAGASVNATEALYSGYTALMAASRNNDLPMVRYLLELGADPDEGSLAVAISGSEELVQTLLEARLHRYKRYSRGYGCGALQHAIKLKDGKMIKLLLAKGIDANAIINRRLGDKAVSSPPLSFGTLGKPFTTPGHSALGLAIKSDKSENFWIVKSLLQGGADPNSIVTDDRQTALLVAIGESNLGLVEFLVASGADANPDLRAGVEKTPLQLAVVKGRIDVVNVLLDNGADINMPPFDRHGATALQYAAIGGYIGIAHLLIQRGADVNASPAKIGGRTALEGAAEHGRIDMLQLLLSAGAQIIGTGLKQYDRARELALENGHRAACRLLEKYSADMWENSVVWDDALMNFGSFEEGFSI